MKEDFLHYIWQNKKFDFSDLKTMQGEDLTISNSGNYLQQEGPDFFNAQLTINNQKWAGNVEIHVKSSDWYLHNHEKDSNYDSVILHVVWEHDSEIYRKDNSEIPVLQLKEYVSKEVIDKYNKLSSAKSWIFCENEIASIKKITFSSWKERLFFERLERKSITIQSLLEETKNDWEAVLFCMLAKNFGLNVNGQSFYELANAIPYSVIKKEANNIENVEAIFFGMGNLLEKDNQDVYYLNLQANWKLLKYKYQFTDSFITPIQFFKLRPDNFPTIRLAQFAQIYFKNHNLFLQLMLSNNKEELYTIFNAATSDYWKNHYNFDKESTSKTKKLTTAFIDLLILNTVIPIKFLYAKTNGNDVTEDLITLISQIKPEKNAVIDKFMFFNIKSKNAFDTQSLLQLKNEYCNQKKCLNCAVGLSLLKN